MGNKNTGRVFPPPPHLSAHAKGIWVEVQARRCVSPERRTLFTFALEAMDRANQASEAINRDGLVTVTKTTGVIHVHPLVKIEKDARAQFSRLWCQLNLEWWGELDGIGKGWD